MTIEDTKNLIAEAQGRIAVMQAYVDGKQIQFFNNLAGKWEDIADPRWSQGSCYRIKPKSEYRPFVNAEECWQEMQKHQPFCWLKDKEDGHYTMVTVVDAVENKKCISIGGNNCWTFNEAMRDYTFADGSPFGILTEEEENQR